MRQDKHWDKLSVREVERIVELMEDNLREEPNSDRNMRLWFHALRYLPISNMDVAIDRIANWRVTGDSPDAYFYLYVLHVLKAIDGSMIEAQRATDLIEQSRRRSRNLRTRTRSYEWLGPGNGIKRLINSSELGEWNKTTEFYAETERLIRVVGRVSDIRAPEAGTLELDSTSLSVFFVPARAHLMKGRDENVRVTFFLGFSYDGPRAWSVEAIE